MSSISEFTVDSLDTLLSSGGGNYYGHFFTVDGPSLINRLWRVKNTGDTASHVLALFIDTDPTGSRGPASLLSLGSANLATGSVGDKIGAAITPVLVTPGNRYLVMTVEATGVDSYAAAGTTVTPASGITIPGTVEFADPSFYDGRNLASPDNTYGPVGFDFVLAPTVDFESGSNGTNTAGTQITGTFGNANYTLVGDGSNFTLHGVTSASISGASASAGVLTLALTGHPALTGQTITVDIAAGTFKDDQGTDNPAYSGQSIQNNSTVATYPTIAPSASVIDMTTETASDLNYNLTDGSGSGTTYLVTCTSYPGTAPTFANATTSIPTFIPPTDGTQYGLYTLHFEYSDSVADITSDLTIHVLPAFGTKDANGFTIIVPSSDTQFIYASDSAGDDGNAGTAGSPVKTLAHARSLITATWSGDPIAPVFSNPVWLVLKSGDTFANQTFGQWLWGGTSSYKLSAITRYGSGARPLVKPPTGDNAIDIQGGGGSPSHMSCFAMVGVEWYAHTRNPDDPAFVDSTDTIGLNWVINGDNLLISDCKARFFGLNINVESGDSNITNVILDLNITTNAYSPVTHSQGLYLSGIIGYTLTNNVFDHNGWIGTDRSAGSYIGTYGTVTGGGPNVFSHNFYGDGSNLGTIVVSGNSSTNPATNCLMPRSGGTIEDNFLLGGAVGVALGWSDAQVTVISQNVFMGQLGAAGIDSNSLAEYGWGLTITENIFSSGGPDVESVITLTGNVDTSITDNIIWDWPNGIVQDGTTTGTVESGNVTDGTGYVDTTRTAGSYNESLGGTGTDDAFIEVLTSRLPGTVDARYTSPATNDYIRAGFTTGPAYGTPTTNGNGTIITIPVSGGTAPYTFTGGATTVTGSIFAESSFAGVHVTEANATISGSTIVCHLAVPIGQDQTLPTIDSTNLHGLQDSLGAIFPTFTALPVTNSSTLVAATPAGFTLTPLSNHAILSWNDDIDCNTNVATKIYRSTDNITFTLRTTINNSTIHTFDDTAAVSGTPYWWYATREYFNSGHVSAATATLTTSPTLTTIVVDSMRVDPSGTATIHATAYDQFGLPMVSQPAFTFSVTVGTGSINSSTGVFTAPSGVENDTVRATSGSVHGDGTVRVALATKNTNHGHLPQSKNLSQLRT